MFNDYLNKYKNALLIGTGGGNDIVSAIIPALELQKKGLNTDIAGILSPGAVHTFGIKLEQVINKLEGSVRRHIPSPKSTYINFIDAYVPTFTSQLGIDIKNFYDFSIRYGTKKLTEEVNNLIKQNNYDVVIGVDVGGDILARGKEDSHLLSPIMDFTTLNLLGNIDVPTYLIEFGLGTDGELRFDGMDAIISSLKKDKTIIFESYIHKDYDEIQMFVKLFDKVKKIRSGHTAVMTLKTLELKEDIYSQYIFNTHIGKYLWPQAFDMFIPKKYFGKTYLMDAKKLYANRKETAFSYENSLEQYIKLKEMQPDWKTEMDMFYLWKGENWKTPQKDGEALFLLIPSKNIRANVRENIIQMGQKYFLYEDIDMTIILSSDKEKLKNQENIIDITPFSLLYKNKTHAVTDTAEQIKSYLSIK